MLSQPNWTPEKPHCVYMHKSPSGKIYIGQTCQRLLCRRFGCNGQRYINTPIFYKAIQKYGWENFEHHIIKDGLTKDEANSLEIKLISEYKSKGASYNVTDGGEGSMGRPCKDETKLKIGAANKGRRHRFTDEQKKSISEGLKGKKHSAERILKNKLSHMGQKAQNKGKIVIHNGDVQKYIFESELESYIATGWIRGCSDKMKTKYNERWSKMSEDSKENIRKAQRERPITLHERIAKSKSHIKHGKYANPKYSNNG